MTGRRQRNGGPGRAPVIASGAVHVVAVVLALWVSTDDRRMDDFIVYEIEIFSPPATELGAPTPPPEEELVVETPDPAPPEPEAEEAPLVVEDTRPDPEPETEIAPPDPEPEPDETEEVARSETPDPEAEESGEDLNVRIEGVQRDYPRYYENIIRQMDRCFRWQGAQNLSTTIYFVINRDGTVSDVDIVTSSGSFSFDIAAAGAAECAGQRNRLGPLPEELPFDRLPIRFNIDPRRGGDAEVW